MKLAALISPPTLRVRPDFILCWLLSLHASLGIAQTVVSHAQVEQQLKQARYQQALGLIQQALTHRPQDPKFLFWQALAQDKLGLTQEAMHGYQSLAHNHPELPEPHNNLGVLMMRSGDFEGAELAFQEALRMNSQYAEALENLGDLLLIKARRLYQQAEKVSPTKMRLQQKILSVPDFPLPSTTQP